MARLGIIAASLLFGILAHAVSPSPTPHISRNKAEALALESTRSTSFPVFVNDAVFAELSRRLATRSSRRTLRKALKQMQPLMPIFEKHAVEQEVPLEVLAVAFVESNFTNSPQSANRWKSAGVWQFMRASARNYGLRVDKKHDERLDIDKATAAAMKYLKLNHGIFGDWMLAILAYNAGPSPVRQGIEKTGSRDAFSLVEAGFTGGDPDYLAKVMASVIILRNPNLAEEKLSP